MNSNNKTVFHYSREFDAPRELVFNAFATAEAMSQWWGPAETKNSVVSFDFRPGGIFHFKMEDKGAVRYGRFIFGKIEPHELLEFNNAFADEQGVVVPAFFDPEFPREIFYRIHFTEHAGKTTITMTGEPVHASAAGNAAFQALHEGMNLGFGASFDILAQYLSGVQK